MGGCSGSLESFSFQSRMAESEPNRDVNSYKSGRKKKPFGENKITNIFFSTPPYLTYLRQDIPSPPEASSSPFGLKRTTLTALVCRARLDRNSTTAFPSGPMSTRHSCIKVMVNIISPALVNSCIQPSCLSTCSNRKSRDLKNLVNTESTK